MNTDTDIAIVADYETSNPVGGFARRVNSCLKHLNVERADTKSASHLYNPLMKSQEQFTKNFGTVLKTVAGAKATHLHLEIGIFGLTPDVIQKNILDVIINSKKLVVFVHSLHVQNAALAPVYSRIIDALNQKAQLDDVIIWVNNKRDHAILKNAFKGKIVFYPVLYFTKSLRSFFQKRGAVQRKKSEDKNIIRLGAFGFMTIHKDYETTLKAFALLPENYRLVICGMAHPNEREEFKRNPNIEIFDKVVWALKDYNIMDRIDFYDGLGDAAFFDLMAGLDVIIANYLEAPMSASSILSQAAELKVPVVASRCTTFEMAEDHFGKAFSFFDPGNSLQLRYKILRTTEQKSTPPDVDFSLEEFAQLLSFK